ncbi:MAG: T9SS type A sorting domain-containing protein [Ignavibacteria bacterium]|nr:T9SS type A sorting domain-containing protein [Ignavibacteria bacterium]
MKYLITIFLLFSHCAFAQISITNSDLNAEYTPGTTTTVKTDVLATTVDIGQLGSTSWDFSFLSSEPGLEINSTAIDPATTPYAGDFPGANLGTLTITSIQGDSLIFYSYLSINGTFDYHGDVGETKLSADTNIVITTTNIPPEISATLPYTFNSIVDYSGTQTIVTEINDTVVNTLNKTIVTYREVDAYGPMTMPGGQIYDALRVRIDEITIDNFFPPPFNYDRHISYDFLTKVGAFVNVPSDTTKPNVGGIANTASIAWAGPYVADVNEEETVPSDYKLYQNYPNPFNPSTNIKYHIPELSYATIKVFDVLGNVIVTLVNEEKSIGSYEVEFDATSLPSGIYFYQLRAGSFVEAKNMILLK